jgi:hypothetical protein
VSTYFFLLLFFLMMTFSNAFEGIWRILSKSILTFSY